MHSDDSLNGQFSLDNLKRGLLLALIIALGYFIPNNYVFFPTHQLVLTSVDHWVTLSPSWIWFYVSYYIILIFAYFFTTGTVGQRVYFGAMSLAAVVGFIVFTFFPTLIARDLYPYSGPMTYSAMLLAKIREADLPVNCFPSMHVCMSFIAAACISLNASRGFRAFVWAWFLAIAYSTMATKQHYFVDIISGLALGVTSVAVFMKVHEVLPDFVDSFSSDRQSPFRLATGARSANIAPRSRFREVVSKLRRRG